MQAETLPLVVVGTGPTAYAAVSALVDAGRTVHVVDIGADLPKSVSRAIRTASSQPPTSWTEETIAGLDHGETVTRLAGKLYFGTDTPYRYPTDHSPITHEAGRLLPVSGSLGGLSNVWGAGILTLSHSELASWPVPSQDMRDAYVAVARRFPIVGCHDSLDSRFPWPFEPAGTPALSSRFRQFVESPKIDGPEEVLFGASRLLVAPLGQGCTGCGRCLSGCPYGAIFDARNLFAELIASGAVTYSAGTVVDSIKETAQGVEVHVTYLDDRCNSTIVGERVLLAAGAVSSVAILQRSGICESTVTVRDSQVFYVPLILGHRWTDDSTHFTLAQVFAASADPDPARDFQLSIYDTSPELAQRFELMAPDLLAPLAARFGHRVARRVVGGIGFLPSELSGSLVMETKAGRTNVKAETSLETRTAIKHVLHRLGRAFLRRQVVLVAPLAQVPGPGEGFHVGAALPMTQTPGPTNTDTLGRPLGTKKVHVIDSTVLPRLHPGPTTFTAMANAHRIASAISHLRP